ncbi:MAG TPA: hypothetical protein VMN36_00635 [Verrucomicrobiales bacterium]|nr:hypothetical protein [Verrucomicrobiales bacterium]
MKEKASTRKRASAAKKTSAKRSKSAAKRSAVSVTVIESGQASKKAGAQKGASKKAARGMAKQPSSRNWTTIGHSTGSGVHLGSVYVIQHSGSKKIRTHVAKKASGKEIRSSLGITESRRTAVRGILRSLEEKGRIKKA